MTSQGICTKYIRSNLDANRHVQVDAYGPDDKDGRGRECSVKGWCGDDDSCLLDEVLPEYKFLLSLESSMCKDFVTRNFFTALRQAVVPVVLGNADYSKLAPPKSYIDVRDFESPSHLASYLKYLMDHPKEYDSYLEWSKSYRVLNNSLAVAMCDLCQKLHETTPAPSSSYANFGRWLTGDGVCWPESKMVWAAKTRRGGEDQDHQGLQFQEWNSVPYGEAFVIFWSAVFSVIGLRSIVRRRARSRRENARKMV